VISHLRVVQSPQDLTEALIPLLTS